MVQHIATLRIASFDTIAMRAVGATCTGSTVAPLRLRRSDAPRPCRRPGTATRVARMQHSMIFHYNLHTTGKHSRLDATAGSAHRMTAIDRRRGLCAARCISGDEGRRARASRGASLGSASGPGLRCGDFGTRSARTNFNGRGARTRRLAATTDVASSDAAASPGRCKCDRTAAAGAPPPPRRPAPQTAGQDSAGPIGAMASAPPQPAASAHPKPRASDRHGRGDQCRADFACWRDFGSGDVRPHRQPAQQRRQSQPVAASRSTTAPISPSTSTACRSTCAPTDTARAYATSISLASRELIQAMRIRKGPYFATRVTSRPPAARISYINRASNSGLALATLGGFGYQRLLAAKMYGVLGPFCCSPPRRTPTTGRGTSTSCASSTGCCVDSQGTVRNDAGRWHATD